MTPTQILQIAAEEEFRIVERVFLANATGKKTVVFTAPDRASGTSWIIAHVARALAKHVQGSVCVVDINLRWPAQHNLFRISNDVGFLQALVKSDPIRNYTEQIDRSNLWVLPSGGTVSDSHGVLLSEHISTRLSELKREYDYILIDAPALKISADATLIGRLTDGAVLVVAADTTKRDAAVNSRLTLEGANTPVLGAVVNKRTYPVPDKIYRYL